MDIIDVILQRRSIRAYDDRPVERDKIERLLEAARLAPSASNRQEWRFVVVTDPEILDHLADTVYRLGRQHQARQYWQQDVTILEHRLLAEENVRNDKERIEGKIRQLNAGKEVTVTDLFSE